MGKGKTQETWRMNCLALNFPMNVGISDNAQRISPATIRYSLAISRAADLQGRLIDLLPTAVIGVYRDLCWSLSVFICGSAGVLFDVRCGRFSSKG